MSIFSQASELPKDILEKLIQLDQELKEEELTIKGYCKRKWTIIQKFAPKHITENMKNIQISVEEKIVDEKEAYLKMFDVLRLEYMFVDKNSLDNDQISRSSENLFSKGAILNSNIKRTLRSTITKNLNQITNNTNNVSSKTPRENCVTKLKYKEIITADKKYNTKKGEQILFLNHCEICKQLLDDSKILNYKGHPQNALNEPEVLSNLKLMLFNEEENKTPSNDLPHHNLTQFSVYDKNSHLCSFDTGLLKDNTQLFFSGYVKPMYEANSSIRNSIPVKDAGPIKNWFTCGFHEGQNALLAISTTCAIYYLMEPSKEYRPFMSEPINNSLKNTIVNNFFNKIIVNKISIENIAQKTKLAEKLKSHEETVDISTKTKQNHLSNKRKLEQETIYRRKKLKRKQFKTNNELMTSKLNKSYKESSEKIIEIRRTRSKTRTELLASEFLSENIDLNKFIKIDSSRRIKDKRSKTNKLLTEKFNSRINRSRKGGASHKTIGSNRKTKVSNKKTKNVRPKTNEKFSPNKLSTTNLDDRISESNNKRGSSHRTIDSEKTKECTKKKNVKQQKLLQKKKKSRRKKFTKATTTELVREVFDSFFPEQLDKNRKRDKWKYCGNCKICMQSDCGECENCKKISEREGEIQQGCIRRQCLNLSSDSESDSSDSINPMNISPKDISKEKINSVSWLSEPITIYNNRTFYPSAKVGREIIKPGDHVLLNADEICLPPFIGEVIYLWEENNEKYFHTNLFCRGIHTVLGETSDKREIFQTDDCENCPLGAIVKKTKIDYKILSPNNTCNEIFFCQKRYDKKHGRFENLYEDKFSAKICHSIFGYKPCGACKRQEDRRKKEIPVLEDGVIKWREEEFKVGTGVYLEPGSFNFKCSPVSNPMKQKIDSIDEDVYPELYRKKAENLLGIEISEPFCIGYITEISKNKIDIEIKVRILYRPENTHNGIILSQKMDMNIVYWSEEQITLPFSKVTGKCFIVYGKLLDIPVQEWSSQGPNRFYFLESYNLKTQEFLPVGDSGRFVGQNFVVSKRNKKLDAPYEFGYLKEPLKTMDVFAGCGGLSEGLHQSGVANTKWAIEIEETAALAYENNNPETIVYSEDCNDLLTQIISGASKTKNNEPLPKKGEVELLVGGPPCQGFSGMNRFNAGQYSLFKNSLIVSYLSYCDYYRPRFFILENVRNFVTFKKGMVLKLTLRCLLAMGYQCSFGVLQAGNYGVPQIRRRSVIIAAAPGEILPNYPEPIHVFNSKRANALDIVIDNCRYNTGSKWLDIGAPYRTITVYDAMSDLPQISNGCSLQNQAYESEPLSHFQRLMRSANKASLLHDHICKYMAPIAEARMSYIPTHSGSDWRDLPNIEIQLSDGTKTNKLKYEWHDTKNGKNSKGSFRGVCPCASKRKCKPSVRQHNTLIPWCLAHTANRHNNWVGLYGRLEWDGVFNTTVTIPEPMAKQGRVVHPTQNRIVSVRECARSQGFPDKYRFLGNIMDKHRQVGNAVPPPLGKAIGQEILKAVILKTT